MSQIRSIQPVHDRMEPDDHLVAIWSCFERKTAVFVLVSRLQQLADQVGALKRRDFAANGRIIISDGLCWIGRDLKALCRDAFTSLVAATDMKLSETSALD